MCTSEEHGFLGNDAKLGAEGTEANLRDVDPIDEHAALAELNKAEQRQDKSGLASTSTPNWKEAG